MIRIFKDGMVETDSVDEAFMMLDRLSIRDKILAEGEALAEQEEKRHTKRLGAGVMAMDVLSRYPSPMGLVNDRLRTAQSIRAVRKIHKNATYGKIRTMSELIRGRKTRKVWELITKEPMETWSATSVSKRLKGVTPTQASKVLGTLARKNFIERVKRGEFRYPTSKQ